MFYCRESAEIKGFGSIETLYRLNSESLRNRQQKHTADRWQNFKKCSIEKKYS